MTSQTATTKTLSNLIDAADVLLPGLSPDQAWLNAVDLVERLGGNALNVVEIDRTTGVPVWFRSSMNSLWLDDYFAQGFMRIDPLIIAGCLGHSLTRMVNGKVRGIDDIHNWTDAYSDQIAQWGYQTLDYHVLASHCQSTFKGITFSHGADAPLPGVSEKLLCALISSVVLPPENRDSPGATALMAYALSTREKDVLRYLAAGLRNDSIASKLGIAEITVRLHITSARRKLGAATREQAIALAMRSGQLQL